MKCANESYVITPYNSFGPTFGSGHEIQIATNANTNISSSNLGYNYKHPQYTAGTNQAKMFLAGSFQFLLSEIEVYKKE